jgi:hypothetical protein
MLSGSPTKDTFVLEFAASQVYCLTVTCSATVLCLLGSIFGRGYLQEYVCRAGHKVHGCPVDILIVERSLGVNEKGNNGRSTDDDNSFSPRQGTARLLNRR